MKVGKWKMEATIEEKAAQCRNIDDLTNEFGECIDMLTYDDVTYETLHMFDRSLEDMIEHDEELPDDLIDYDSCGIAIEHLMVDEFMDSLSRNERHIVEYLMNGMTHDEISATMDCTRQNVTRCVERICKKANDLLPYN